MAKTSVYIFNLLIMFASIHPIKGNKTCKFTRVDMLTTTVTFHTSKTLCRPFSTQRCYKYFGIETKVKYYTKTQYYEDCCAGYRKNQKRICEPVCTQECVNSNCTEPNHCECYQGYQRSSETNVCTPVCSQTCSNGECTAPETCTCISGYKNNAHNKHICEPICSESCENGNCTSPQTCTCFPGYEKRVNYTNICHPVCTEGCENGNCTSPQTCTCFPGYEKRMNYTNICHPVCTEGCENAVCIAPEKCKCNKGFIAFQEFPNKCELYCSNGNLTSPETCTCWEGYRSNSNNSCSPVCSKQCKNGHCSAPETCECLEGYVLHKDDPFVCIPFCSDCQNGQCTSYETCSCFQGYDNIKDYSTCLPVCNEECMNGFCSSPNVCSCHNGYKTNIATMNICNPQCSLKCINGNCIKPETCECFDGYVPTNVSSNVCQPFCSSPCINGSCTQPERCSCLWGFVHDRNDSSMCFLHDEESGCKTIRAHKPLLKYTNDSCFDTGDYVLASFVIKNCHFMYTYFNKYILQNNEDNYDQVISFSCKLAQSGNNYTENSVQLDCNILANVKSETESSVDKFTMYSSTRERKLDSSSMVRSVLEHAIKPSIDIQDSNLNNVTNTTGTLINTTVSYSKTKGKYFNVENIVFNEEDHNMHFDADKQTTQQPLSTAPILKDISVASDVSIERVSTVGINTHNLVIKLLWVNFITKNNLTVDTFKVNTNQTALYKILCLCHNEENRRFCFGKKIRLVLCRCPPQQLQNIKTAGMKLMYVYVITMIILLVVVATVLKIIYKRRTKTDRIQISTVSWSAATSTTTSDKFSCQEL